MSKNCRVATSSDFETDVMDLEVKFSHNSGE